MKITSSINVSLTKDDVFVLVDPDTGKTVTVNSGVLHDKRYFVVSAIEQHFLEKFPGKQECVCTPEAESRIQSIADWNEDFED